MRQFQLEDSVKSVCSTVFTCLYKQLKRQHICGEQGQPYPRCQVPIDHVLAPSKCAVQDKKKRCRSPDGGTMHWWPLERQHVIAIMKQHHRHHLAQIYKTEVSASFRTVSHKGTFPFFMMLLVIYYLWILMTWTMRLQCWAQEYSEHHGTFDLQ